MNGVRFGSILCPAIAAVFASAVSRADDWAVNGYTYVAPSTYLTPPIVVYDPTFVIPAQSVIYAGPAYVPPRVVYAPPAPVVGYGPVVAPMAYRERVRVGPRGVGVRYNVYSPGRLAPVYRARVRQRW